MNKIVQLGSHILMHVVSVVALTCLSVSGFSVHAQSNPPVLFYYSADQGSFIVERADGTETRILTNFKEPCNGCEIMGPGWSPSGKWFAWTTGIYGSGGPSDESEVMIVDRNGTEKQSLLNGLGKMRNLRWSPVADLLLFEHDERGLNNTIEYYVWDVESRDLKFKLSVAADISHVDWTPNGKYVALYITDSKKHESSMQVMSLDGKVIANRALASLGDNGSSSVCPPSWFSDSRVVYINAKSKLVFEDFAGNTFNEYDFAPKYLLKVDWKSDGSYGLVYANDICQEIDIDTTGSLWLLSTVKRTMQNLSNTVRVGLAYGNNTYLFSPPVWSPQGDEAIYITQENPQRPNIVQLNVIETQTSKVTPLTVIGDKGSAIKPGFFQWLDNNKLAFFSLTPAGNSAIYVYDVTTNQPKILLEGTYVNAPFSVSSNGAFIALSSSECAGACVVNLKSLERYRIKFQHSIPEIEGNATELGWHLNEPWLFLTSEPIGGRRWLNVSNMDGSNVRTLGKWQRIEPSSFGWLPN